MPGEAVAVKNCSENGGRMSRKCLGGMALVAALVAFGGVGCATKAKSTAGLDAFFMNYDGNRDGVVTHEEFTAQWHDQVKAENAWKKIDKASAGSVTRSQAADTPIDVWGDLESDREP